MEEDIARLGQALILTEEEELGVVMPAGIWHSDSDSGGFHTVGRVLSHKSYHMEALKTLFQSALNPAKGMTISFIENDRFLLKFFHSVDRDRVLASGPWAFEKNLIVLAKVAENDNPAAVDLNWCDFHVRIHRLPIGRMTSDIARFIGEKIGRPYVLDQTKGPESCGSYLRFRIAIDVTKPLPRALKIRTVLGDEQLVTFTYERLPNFCYICGRLGHISQWCESRFQPNFVDLGDSSPYGPWLRAHTRAAFRTRFLQTNNLYAASQSFRPRFTSREKSPVAPHAVPTRGGAIFGTFTIPAVDTGQLDESAEAPNSSVSPQPCPTLPYKTDPPNHPLPSLPHGTSVQTPLSSQPPSI
ncbi:UNVERIFIED_CONTAM: hypothetical protein Sradi_5437900 [Sesamum radiatum]|uniref:CCHC-type domain-containing protein n=1 Tax=Sesamum radiatum TaxID=300843 RepID=A0AAW2LAF4_SESRA